MQYINIPVSIKSKALKTKDLITKLLPERTGSSKKGQKIEAHTVLGQMVINKE